MTNMEYIMWSMTERDLADLFQNGYRFCTKKSSLSRRIEDAFENWRTDNNKPKKNYFNSDEKERPSVWQWQRVCKDGIWGSYGYRTFSVAFQHWLCLQYNEKHWRTKPN